MPIITLIKPQKRQKRVNIYLDGKFSSKGQPASGWGFGLDLENFVKSGLKVGQELSEKEIEEIVKKAEFQKVYDKILRFATLRPRSKKEFKDWLHRKKVPQILHKVLFNRLKRLDFLNDQKFAAWWVEQRQSFRPRSKRIMNYELRIKGVKKEIIDDVLAVTKIDEVQVAKKLIEKKKYRWEKLGPYEARKKMSGFLQRKGFGWDVIKEVLKDF